MGASARALVFHARLQALPAGDCRRCSCIPSSGRLLGFMVSRAAPCWFYPAPCSIAVLSVWPWQCECCLALPSVGSYAPALFDYTAHLMVSNMLSSFPTHNAGATS